MDFIDTSKDEILLRYIESVVEKSCQEEENIKNNLGNSAQRLIGLIAVILGFQLIKIDSIKLSNNFFESLFSLIALSFLFISLLYSILSLFPYGKKYDGLPKDFTIFTSDKTHNLTPLTARKGMIKCYIDIIKNNSQINHYRGNLIYKSSAFGLLGSILTVFSFLFSKFL